MTSLVHRATPQQRRLFRAVEGAVKNVADAHPKWDIDPELIARSIAKRAAGTLSAQWTDVLAARSVPSDGAVETVLSRQPRGAHPRMRLGRGSSYGISRRPSLRSLWKQLAFMAGQAKRDGKPERLEAMQDVLRMVAKMQREN